MSIIKPLKIALPLATATSATIATTFLVSSFNKRDELLKEKELDTPLSDFNFPNEKFEDVKKFYAENGNGDGKKPVDDETAKKISELLENVGDLKNSPNLDQNLETLQKEIEKLVKSDDAKSNILQNESDSAEEENTDLHESLSTSIDQAPKDGVSIKSEDSDEDNEVEEGGVQLPLGKEFQEKQASEPHESTPVTEKRELENQMQDSGVNKLDGREQDIEERIEHSEQVDINHQEENTMGDENDAREKNMESESLVPENIRKTDEGEELVEAGLEEASSSENLSESGSSGNKEKLSAEDIEKWKHLEDKISSVFENLEHLINI